MKCNEWKIEYDIPDLPRSLLEAGYNPLLSYVLALRGYDTAEKAKRILDPATVPLHDPFLLNGMETAVARVQEAITNGEKVAVYGDYDVDGITSTCLLTDYLRSCGLDVTPYIPDRDGEGYGLNCTALEDFYAKGISLVITVDCGITAVVEAVYARQLGMDLIITDHHECKPGVIPDASSVIDCKRPDADYPEGTEDMAHLAGVGVAFQFVCACSGDSEKMLERYADLVAVGTIADVMPLTPQNRYLVKKGLKKLKTNTRIGFDAIFQASSIDKAALNAGTIGFILSPRLNAAGRLGKAIVAVDMLLTDDPQEAETLAHLLCDMNRERQSIENSIWKEALARLQGMGEIREPIVLSDGSWHQGVIGIAASKLAEKYHVPTIMICLNGEIGKGSCRSTAGFNLFEALSACNDHLVSFGGHALAAGLNIRSDQIAEFRKAITDYYNRHIPEPQPEISCDLLICDPSILTEENVASLDLLEPFGNSFPRPVFGMLGVRMESSSAVGAGKHLKMRIRAGEALFDAIFFSHTKEELGIDDGDYLDIAFTPQINDFHGRRSVQLNLSAAKKHDVTALCKDILEQNCTHVRAVSPFTPERSDFVEIWKIWRSHSFAALGSEFSSVISSCPSDMVPERYCLCLKTFQEAGLLENLSSGIYGSSPVPKSGKADLEATEIMRLLRCVQF